MGANYYLHKSVCSHCGRGDEPIHIGKSSAGWCFGLHVIPEEGIHDLLGWNRLFDEPGNVIKSEYGEVISADSMRAMITQLSRSGSESRDSEFLRRNHAELGPNNLLRHRVDGFCIGHGEGTYDLIVGQFS